MRAWRAWAGFFCAASLGASAWHIAHNVAPPAYDDAWYLEMSFRLFESLRGGLGPFFREYSEAFHIKAPLIALLPLPLYALFGVSERVAVWANLPCMAASLFFIHGIASALYDERAGWAAAAAYALMPLSYGLCRLFFVETLLSALVCGTVWAILRAKPGHRGDALGAWLGFGLLAKITFPLFIAGPAWRARATLRPLARRGLLVGALLALSWYAFNAAYIAGYAWSAGFGKVARDYGQSPLLSPAAWGLYGRSIARDVFSWPGAALLLLLGALAYRRGWRWTERERWLSLWAGLPLAVFTLGVNKDVRLLAPALPAVAVGIGALAAGLSRRRGAAWLLAGLGAVWLAVLSGQTFGWPRPSRLVYNEPASSDPGWDRDAVIDALAGHPRPVAALAFEHTKLNANNLSSRAAARRLKTRFINLGYAQDSVEAALIRLTDKGATHLVFVEGEVSGLPAFLNRVNEQLRARVESGRVGAARVARVPLCGEIQAVVYALGVQR